MEIERCSDRSDNLFRPIKMTVMHRSIHPKRFQVGDSLASLIG